MDPEQRILIGGVEYKYGELSDMAKHCIEQMQAAGEEKKIAMNRAAREEAAAAVYKQRLEQDVLKLRKVELAS